MPYPSILQCSRAFDFHPLAPWPRAFPAMAWKGYLLTAFERQGGDAVDLYESNGCTLVEALKACYPELGLSEVSRLLVALEQANATLARELTPQLIGAYGWRWCDRLQTTLQVLNQTPAEFQRLVDDKKSAPRDLAPLLALPEITAFAPFLRALVETSLSKFELARALELGVELFLLGLPLADLMPVADAGYLRRLEKWRRPSSSGQDEHWREKVTRWPWPAQVQGAWQRFGDQTGLEIKIRTTSPQDFQHKLEKLGAIRDTWSCNG